MKFATSYFYQIRNFKPNMIPISTAMSDPEWFRPKDGKEYYIDKRGIICGLRYKPLIVQTYGQYSCNGPEQCWYANADLRDPLGNKCQCPTMQEYRYLLETYVDKDKLYKAFDHCAKMFKIEDPIFVLIVYEAPTNPCSERLSLQQFFNCKELEYPIR